MYRGIVALLAFAALAWGDVPDFDAPHHPSRILVRFAQGTSQQSKQSLHQTLGTGPVLQEYAILNDLQLVEVPEGTVEDSVMVYLDDPCVVNAEPDYERDIADCLPNDPSLYTGDGLWGIRKVRSPAAWCVQTGDEDFLVAVIDTGMTTRT